MLQDTLYYEDADEAPTDAATGLPVATGEQPLTRREFAAMVAEAVSQPAWRAQADREADYADGNQLSSELLQRQKAIGIPPAKENIIGPAIRAVCGQEAKTRTDWRITPDGDPAGQDVADVLNYKLNQAERYSRADRTLSQAFQAMVTVGLGWVEVSRAATSREFPIKCRYVHRNEIWWDMKAQEPDLTDARWLMRRRWVDRERAALMFPESAWLLQRNAEDWIGDYSGTELDGGKATGLMAAAHAERAWTNQEDAWYNNQNRQVCITEVWYRRWAPTTMLRMTDGRAVEYDEANPAHLIATMSNRGRLVEELQPRVRRGYWCGPHRLYDEPSPYPHESFPYVPVFGYREDTTGIPFGLVRDMLFPQDNLNSSIAKLRWGMAATRTERTKGAVAMNDEQLRRTVARPDADIVLDANHMAQPGARFDVKRDFQLNAQQFQLMNDSRQAIGRMGVSTAFMGQSGSATSGLQEQTQLEQSQVSLADLMDAFKDARTAVGEQIMALLIEDMGQEPQQIVIEGDTLNPPRMVAVNQPEQDEATGITYLSNDVQRTRLKVALEDVPTTSSFRSQQLNALSEAIKAAPAEVQRAAMPFMIDLMDLPRKKSVVEAIRQAEQQQTPEQVREQVKQEIMHDLKERELALREREVVAREAQLKAQAVNTGVTSTFAAMQAAEKIALNPLIAPVGDVVMKQAGWQAPTPEGMDPNIPTPQQADPALAAQYAAASLPVAEAGGEPGDTSPLTPQLPATPNVGADQGIETLRHD